jgi:hypothetical protein
MDAFFAKLNGGELIALVAVLIGPVVAIVAVVASQWRKVRIAEMEGALKQQMLDKGMSAAEIEKVMTASSGGVATISSTGNDALDKAALAQRMVDEGYEGADIERVLRAYQQPTPPEKPIAGKVG